LGEKFIFIGRELGKAYAIQDKLDPKEYREMVDYIIEHKEQPPVGWRPNQSPQPTLPHD